MDSQRNDDVPDNVAFKDEQAEDAKEDVKFLTDKEVWALVAKMQHWHMEA